MIGQKRTSKADNIRAFLAGFRLNDQLSLFPKDDSSPLEEHLCLEGQKVPVFINEFWTSKQRQALSIHEISYRACYKPQLPRFFIELLTDQGDVVYDPFAGRGTTAIEAGLLNRRVASNDVNPLSQILAQPRFFVPNPNEVRERLISIPRNPDRRAEINLAMFYHPATEAEIVALQEYLRARRADGKEDQLDAWIRMVATNRLTGHSSGFFSVYTLPPNQAVGPDRQIKINQLRNQAPVYRNTTEIILRKTRSLTADLSRTDALALRQCGETAMFLCEDARHTSAIPNNSVSLTVTSPPFLDVVQYAADNWLRCWFNGIDMDNVASKITNARALEQWTTFIKAVFQELYRITKPTGWVAFEVGEVKAGRIKLEEHVVPAGLSAGFQCEGVLINKQVFTKTANIWGISNNSKGTNTNRIVLFSKL